jgi:hypothetical protein
MPVRSVAGNHVPYDPHRHSLMKPHNWRICLPTLRETRKQEGDRRVHDKSLGTGRTTTKEYDSWWLRASPPLSGFVTDYSTSQAPPSGLLSLLLLPVPEGTPAQVVLLSPRART